MIREMILPQLAMGMSEGTPVKWVVKEGERTERDKTVVEIETEKVTTELPAPYSGFLHIVVEAGSTVPIETTIAKIAESFEEYQQLTGGAAQAAQVPSVAAKTAESPTEATTLEDAGEGQLTGKPRISGLAKKLAQDHAIPLSAISGTGPGGRIVREDVLAAIEATARPVAALEKPNVVDGMIELARVRIAGMRKTIADRTLSSKTTAAHTYTFFEVDISKLVAARNVMLDRESEIGSRISMISIISRALAFACQHSPICNSTLIEDEIIIWKNVNIGIVVSLPAKGPYESGLIIPVVRDVQSKNVLQIDREIKDLTGRAREGRLSAADLSGGTITLSSSMGFMPGVWSTSTPLIFLPQVVAFQPGTPIDKPIAVDGQVVIRKMLPCSLTFDHRAMDGEPPSRLKRRLADLLANPELMML